MTSDASQFALRIEHNHASLWSKRKDCFDQHGQRLACAGRSHQQNMAGPVIEKGVLAVGRKSDTNAALPEIPGVLQPFLRGKTRIAENGFRSEFLPRTDTFLPIPIADIEKDHQPEQQKCMGHSLHPFDFRNARSPSRISAVARMFVSIISKS